MALGGIFDQLGGGFCRYSVDDEWMIPHFEKMLYDNGQLQVLYADAFAATGLELFRQTAAGIGEWVMREMQSPEGGYYSSLDADSEGHEGKFYVWDTDEMRALLTPEEWSVVEARYGLAGEPNFEGRWHPHTRLDDAALAALLRLPESEAQARLACAHRKLFDARARRVRPGRDDKILTSWNALMIKGMARAAWRLGRVDFLDSAERAFDFVRTRLWKNGRLLATYKDGKAHLNAYLDDYVYLMDAGLELLAARWRDGTLDFVTALADTLLERFKDNATGGFADGNEARAAGQGWPGGGFFFTADDHERLVYRPKPAGDDATPSGNGVAAQVLARLGHLLGDVRYLDAARRTVEGLYTGLAEHPSAHASLAIALDEYLDAPQTIVLRGETEQAQAWLARARAGYRPWRQVYAIPRTATLPEGLASREAGEGVVAYVCRGDACEAPRTALADFEAALAAAG
jgi:uncharacterized protein YyaL (SSP411 family)